MQVHGYTEFNLIEATIDGLLMTVPNDPANRHRQMIAEWEAEGNTIPAYLPSPTPEPSDEEILAQAMREEFIERMATNKTAPAHLKEAALRVKAKK